MQTMNKDIQIKSVISSVTGLTIVFTTGEIFTVAAESSNYQAAIVAVREQNATEAYALCQPMNLIVQRAAESEHEKAALIKVQNGKVYYDGEVMNNTLCTKMVDMLNEGFDIKPMIMFLDNLMSNPSNRAVTELYEFMKRGNLPITIDGHLVAYKRVRADFKDFHSGKFDNSPGKECKMRRNEVDDQKENTCSNGLHFCSKDYLSSYHSGSGRVVCLKINPRDVVSIPIDYSHTKGRCCRYTVISEITDLSRDPLKGASIFLTDLKQKKPGYHPVDEPKQPSILKKEEPKQPVEKKKAPNPLVFRNRDKNFLNASDLKKLARVPKGLFELLPKEPKAPVVQIDLNGEGPIAVFESAVEAESATGANVSSIRKVCNGQRQKAGDYGWAWLTY